jgi:hypothetical protein
MELVGLMARITVGSVCDLEGNGSVEKRKLGLITSTTDRVAEIEVT